MKLKLLSIVSLAIFQQTFAQSEKFYATTDAKNAAELKSIMPNEIDIIQSVDDESVIFLSPKAAEFLHHNVITHGPGYVYTSSEQEAL